MLERQPFMNKHLNPKKSLFKRIENVTDKTFKYKVVYVKSNRVYRRLFFNNFRYADQAFVAMSKKLLGFDEPLWNISKYSMVDGKTTSRVEGMKKWILRRVKWNLY